MQTLPFSEVRAQLADALRSVEADNTPLLISRRGESAGVLMSVAHYRQLTGADQGFISRLHRWRQQYPEDASESPEEDPFANVRQRDEGRHFEW